MQVYRPKSWACVDGEMASVMINKHPQAWLERAFPTHSMKRQSDHDYDNTEILDHFIVQVNVKPLNLYT